MAAHRAMTGRDTKTTGARIIRILLMMIIMSMAECIRIKADQIPVGGQAGAMKVNITGDTLKTATAGITPDECRCYIIRSDGVARPI